jgi:hypothetical protein
MEAGGKCLKAKSDKVDLHDKDDVKHHWVEKICNIFKNLPGKQGTQLISFCAAREFKCPLTRNANQHSWERIWRKRMIQEATTMMMMIKVSIW